MRAYGLQHSPHMKPLSIGFVFDDSLDKTDGVQQYIMTAGSWLSEQGHDVQYLVGQTSRTDLPRIHSLSRNAGVRFNGNRLSIPLPASRHRIGTILSDTGFDVLHVQMPYSPWLAGRVIRAASSDTAVVGTFHIVPKNRAVELASSLLRVMLRRSLKRFDAVVSVSSAAQDFAKRSFGIDSTILPNVIDTYRFSEAKPLERYKDGIVTVLFLGRLVPRKGCLYLLQAVRQLRQVHPEVTDFRVVVCGKGPLDRELKEYIGKHGLQPFVSFEGFVSEAEKPQFLASADVAVFPSTGGESFGIVLVEAMAGGHAAVLGGDNSGYRTVLGKQPDLLVNPRNIQEFAERLYTFITDRSARNDAARWGVAQSMRYDVNNVGQELLAIYSKALHKRRNVA